MKSSLYCCKCIAFIESVLLLLKVCCFYWKCVAFIESVLLLLKVCCFYWKCVGFIESSLLLLKVLCFYWKCVAFIESSLLLLKVLCFYWKSVAWKCVASIESVLILCNYAFSIISCFISFNDRILAYLSTCVIFRDDLFTIDRRLLMQFHCAYFGASQFCIAL